ncbi:putative membrane protein [Paucibacter oligotrophus]|uniref:Putative membrane protein n=1 Tax=Roseateles oligotrophus TaxID=1769250 RepID=A0A840L5N9_9BURK|nr:PH domain-containing protein [Roseateles oligotrophus]MBB4843336.1 putative membrane protein [Roseateles oligotrophus]
MTEPLAPAAPEPGRLHPLSCLFGMAGMLKELALPLIAFLFLGRREEAWVMWALIPLVGLALWSLLQAWVYRYELHPGELLIRDGLLDKTQRHVPFARIHNIHLRRNAFHRLLGVAELRLDSASGGKPEAVMKVLGMQQALALEALLRGAGEQPAQPSPASSGPTARPLLQLPTPELLRLGLISNHGMVMVALLTGALMHNEAGRKLFFNQIEMPLRWLRQQLTTELALQHWQGLVLATLLGLPAALILLRGLSVAWALLKYHDFRLELDGEKLLARHGLLTQVRAGARLPRLQRFELVQSWLHRRFGRCRLEVQVAGGKLGKEHGLESSGQLHELAPIATPAQAQALLKLCLPQLDWPALQWQPLHPRTAQRRLLGQARWLLPLLLLLLAVAGWRDWPALPLAGGLLPLTGLWVWHAIAWARFAAWAEVSEAEEVGEGSLLLFRSGALTQRWVIVAAARLQSLRHYSSGLDRCFGMQHLQTDTQGGSSQRRALDIPFLPADVAQGLRQRLWERLGR